MARVHASTMKPIAQTSDLQRIKGIGPATARYLQTAGISSCAQLAKLSPGEIVAAVPELSAKRIKQEAWLKQARALTVAGRGQKQRKDKLKCDRSQHYATFMVELLLNQDNSVRRTEVVYVQGHAAQHWAGWEEQRLADFFRQQAGLKKSTLAIDVPFKLAVAPGAVAATELPVTPRSIISATNVDSESAVEPEPELSGQLQFCDLSLIPIGSLVPRSIVRAGQPFHVRVGLDLSGVMKATSSPIAYSVTLWAKRLGCKSREIVGQVQGDAQRQLVLTHDVEAAITVPGTYRLEAIAILTDQGTELLPRHRLMATRTSGLLQVF